MSFMYNPFPYDDPRPVNKPQIPRAAGKELVRGSVKVAAKLASLLSPGQTIAIDGYTGADFERTVNLLEQQLHVRGLQTRTINFRTAYKSPEELWELVDGNLSWDRSEDPTLLFGRIWKGGYEGLLDESALGDLRSELAGSHAAGLRPIDFGPYDEERGCSSADKQTAGSNNSGTASERLWPLRRGERVLSREEKEPAGSDDIAVTIVYGHGCLIPELRDLYEMKVWLDVSPKESILRIRRGQYINLGLDAPLTTPLIIRRCYYCDFEVAVGLRRELLAREGNVDFWVENDHPDDMKMLPWKAFSAILGSLSQYPFRCKPVYLEGVWGGTYVKKLRGLPDTMRNCAWVFDLIPMEVSVLVDVEGTVVEVPFSTFFMKEGDAVLGPDVVKKFGGYFPIRFNYDDSYHSTGNMSIQCHSGSAFNKERFDEFGRQDESYYVVATGHGAKTFIGFRDDADIPQFFKDIEAADTRQQPVDYLKYVSYEESRPGLQVMLPAGTIHSSGRNQVILEIGSLTIGSYTYKMYDYLRLDFDGKQRPIHTKLGELNVARHRRASEIRNPQSPDYIVQQPRLAAEGEGWQEYIVGESELLYFSLRRLEFERRCEQTTGDRFHVLTLVDGEKIRVRSLEHPERFFDAEFMDLVVVPADMGRYEILNLGAEPICVHKTMLRDGYADVIL